MKPFELKFVSETANRQSRTDACISLHLVLRVTMDGNDISFQPYRRLIALALCTAVFMPFITLEQ